MDPFDIKPCFKLSLLLSLASRLFFSFSFLNVLAWSKFIDQDKKIFSQKRDRRIHQLIKLKLCLELLIQILAQFSHGPKSLRFAWKYFNFTHINFKIF